MRAAAPGADAEMFARWRFNQAVARADAGDPSAYVEVALCSLYGIGTPVSGDAGFAWLQAGAFAGSPECMNYLAEVYKNGYGVPVDFDAARAWLEKAAEHDTVESRENLALFLAEHGESDEEHAELLRQVRRAADLGNGAMIPVYRGFAEKCSERAINLAETTPTERITH